MVSIKASFFACFSVANPGSRLSRRHPCRWSGGDASGEKYLEKCFMEGSQSPFSKATTTDLQDLRAGEDVRHVGESLHVCAEHLFSPCCLLWRARNSQSPFNTQGWITSIAALKDERPSLSPSPSETGCPLPHLAQGTQDLALLMKYQLGQR